MKWLVNVARSFADEKWLSSGRPVEFWKIVLSIPNEAAYEFIRSTKPLSCQVFYGGLGGQGKRIDMVIKTPMYKMKVNIRDTQGTDGYPTRIMGDFTYL